MQMYNGLPIMTNKISDAEQQGIAHHLLGHVSLNDEPWDIDDFRREATQVIQEIRRRGNLPIVVGGTAYYVDSLLFPDTVIDEKHPDSEPLAVLEEPTDVLYAELKKVDPEMALHWHPNDRRKIMRSLEIYLRTGRRASEIYAEQRERRSGETQSSPWENLLFWVYSEREVLKNRLDARVDKMLDMGLMDEVRQLADLKRREEAAGRTVDVTRGIWQSIGYKQLEPYLMALEEGRPDDELNKLRNSCTDDMKTGTRRYAMYQNRWTKQKKIPHLKQEGPEALDSLYILDSTDVSRFGETAVEPAAQITEQFLRGEARAHPSELSDLARGVLSEATQPRPQVTPCERTCEVCNVAVTTEEQWRLHVRGRMHRVRMKKRKKLALVPVPDGGPAPEVAAEATDTQEKSEGDGEGSGPDVGAIFHDGVLEDGPPH